jgi:tetratricopeptide (TPR) repeat protein
VHYFRDEKPEALQRVNQFLQMAQQPGAADPPQMQIADALHQKGKILLEMGQSPEALTTLNEALQLRRELLGETDPAVAESMCLIGKVLLQQEQYAMALNAFEMGLVVQRQSLGEAGSLEVAQTLLEMGRVYHAQKNFAAALSSYLEVSTLARQFFGESHPFVSRIDTIIGRLYLDMGETDKAQAYLSKENGGETKEDGQHE